MKSLCAHINPHGNEYCDLPRRVLQSLSTALDLLVQQETKLQSCSLIQNINNSSLSLKRKKQNREKAPNKKRKTEDSKSIYITMAPHYDGYKWRKYGEKTIQNSAYPRTYYRCTHKNEGCLATKKIQQQDDDKYNYESPMFQVIYENKHSCSSSRTSNDEYVFCHHDQSSSTVSEAKKSSPFQSVIVDNIIDGEHDHNSPRLDIDQNLFNELSSALKIEEEAVNCDSAVETNNFHTNPNWIPYQPEYCHDLESLLSSFS